MTRRAPAKAPPPVGTGVGPSGTPRRRKRAPAGPASYTAWPCVILAVDAGRVSGWSVFVSGSPVAAGHGDVPAVCRYAIKDVIKAAVETGLPVVVAAESWPLRWRPNGAPREAWGMWLASLDGMVPKRRIVRVQVGRWSAKILGSCALSTAQRRQRSVAVAGASLLRAGWPARTLSSVPEWSHDEAAAVCIGLWASHAAEVGRVLPKGRAKR